MGRGVSPKSGGRLFSGAAGQYDATLGASRRPEGIEVRERGDKAVDVARIEDPADPYFGDAGISEFDRLAAVSVDLRHGDRDGRVLEWDGWTWECRNDLTAEAAANAV